MGTIDLDLKTDKFESYLPQLLYHQFAGVQPMSSLLATNHGSKSLHGHVIVYSRESLS